MTSECVADECTREAARGFEKCFLCKRDRCSMCGCGTPDCDDEDCEEEVCGETLYSLLDKDIGTCLSCREGAPKIIRDNDE